MRAAAGQSKHAIKSAQDNYRSAALVYSSPSLRPEAKAPFIGKPIAKADEIPSVAFHRTRPARWKRIVKEGLTPGGGEFVGSDRAHVYYLAASRITETDYQSGLRGKHPIQLTIALREAVDSGLIFFKNRSGGIRTIDVVPPEFIISVENTESKSTLWTRVSASGLPDEAPAASGEGSRAAVTGEPRPAAKAMPVSLTATSKSAPASKAAPSTPPTSTRAPTANEPEPPSSAPPATAYSGYAPPEPEGPPPGFENPITAPAQRKGRKLTVVQVECNQSLVLRGMTHCDVCSAELASNTELPEETVTRLSVLRRQQLARAGLARTESPVSDYINAGFNLRVVSASGRGNMSPEAIMIQDARSRMKRADKCGFQSIEDRFEHDIQFMERTLQMGYDYRAAQRQDWLCHVHLANPPRNRAQVSLGLGYDEDHSLARLAYIDVAPDRFPQAMDYIPEQWCVIYRTNILSLRKYAEYINSPTWRS